MGFLTIFGDSPKPELQRLASGTFTIDSSGRLISSTVPQSMSANQVRDIGAHILAIFEGARSARLPFQEMVVHYGDFKITAREMRGGAIVFLTPKGPKAAPGATP